MNINTEQYFSTVPQINCPRSVFDRSFTVKTSMNTDYLYPIFIDEMLPGDTFKLSFQAFGRLIDPLVVPVMDELYFETLWFKCPNRLLWSHWVNFCGEQDNPTDSVDYLIPTVTSPSGGFGCMSMADMFGIPAYVGNLEVNALPFRMYNRVYNEWFRDENLVNSLTLQLGDSDNITNYALKKSAKIHDLFTSCLPFAQKFGSVQLPLGDSAPVITGSEHDTRGANVPSLIWRTQNGGLPATSCGLAMYTNGNTYSDSVSGGLSSTVFHPTNLHANLQNATGASINDFRFAIKLQQKRERDALGGTRYIEWVKMHFNCDSYDLRAFRTEFLGSTRELIDINTVVQTSSSTTTSPQGNLSAFGVISHHGAGFSTSATEHSYVMGLARIRHNPVYQQGLDKLWKRSTLLDFYLPVFNGIGEQPVNNYEIYAQDDSVDSNNDGISDNMSAFGFNEAYYDYRFKTSKITGILNSNAPYSLDVYHLAQNFSQLPLLNQSFIEESVPMSRVLAIDTSDPDESARLGIAQFIFDFRFNLECARPMPVRNIPSGLDRF